MCLAYHSACATDRCVGHIRLDESRLHQALCLGGSDSATAPAQAGLRSPKTHQCDS